VQEYSFGALDAKWDEKQGFSLIAQKDITKGEIPLQIPCHYVVSAFDYFPYKDDFLLILRDVKEVNQGEIHTMALLALRYLSIEVLKMENPFNYTS
jgi:hypothetical protein